MKFTPSGWDTPYSANESTLSFVQISIYIWCLVSSSRTMTGPPHFPSQQGHHIQLTLCSCFICQRAARISAGRASPFPSLCLVRTLLSAVIFKVKSGYSTQSVKSTARHARLLRNCLPISAAVYVVPWYRFEPRKPCVCSFQCVCRLSFPPSCRQMRTVKWCSSRDHSFTGKGRAG